MNKQMMLDRKAKLQQRLAEYQNKSVLSTQIPQYQHKKAPRLSLAQQRLWFSEKLYPDSAMYNIPQAIRLEGELNHTDMEKAIQQLIQRHHILRTQYKEEDHEIRQYIKETPQQPLIWIEMMHIDQAEREQEIMRRIEQLASQPFQIENGKLFHAYGFRLHSEVHFLFFNFHHSITDGWSSNIFWKELKDNYSRINDPQISSSPLAIQYYDYAEWERSESESQADNPSLQYWTNYLENASPTVLPYDHHLSAPPSHQGRVVIHKLSESLSQHILQQCESNQVTSYLFLMTAFNLFLHKVTGDIDITIGTPTAGRVHKETYDLIGFFVNMITVRTSIDIEQTFKHHLLQTKEQFIQSMEHQHVSFEQITHALKRERQLEQHPFFQITFTYQQESDSFQWAPFQTEMLSVNNHTSKFDLSLFTSLQNQNEFEIVCEYNAQQFDHDRIEQFVILYEKWIQQILVNPDQPLNQLSLVSLEKQSEWLNTTSTHPQVDMHSFESVISLFLKHVLDSPDHIAISIGDQEYSYAYIHKQSNQVANYLKKEGIVKNEFVGIHLQRSVYVVIAILGIMKAGAAYVPLDPAYPEERIQYMLNNAKLKYIISEQCHITTNEKIQWVNFDYILQDSLCTNEYIAIDIQPTDVAYMIFTSGSTGAPKGVVVEHLGLWNLVQSQKTIFDIKQEERILQFASISFDASVWEIFMALGNGATLCMLPGEWKDMKQDIISIFNHYRITLGTFPSSFLMNIEPTDIPSLNKVIVAGERCPVELAKRWSATTLFWNAYGPSESTVCATIYPYIYGEKIPIGYPLPNIEVYVMDQYQNAVPAGIPGELYIGGVALAREYYDDPVKTAARFMHYSLAGNTKRLYRTGDLVKYQANGVLEFLDRIDNQVKIRGYRIELGEIEHHLMGIPAICEALVKATEYRSGQLELIAYLVPNQNMQVDESDIRAQLLQHLPTYMIPAHIMVLEVFPLTVNGKINHKKLPIPSQIESKKVNNIIGELSAKQQLFLETCQIVLRRSLRLEDHFFEVGGDSILSLKLMNQLKQKGWQLTPRSFYQYPILNHLIDQMKPIDSFLIDTDSRIGTIPLAPMQQWFFEQNFTDSHHWNFSLLFEIKSSVEINKIEQALQQLYEHHDTLHIRFCQTEGRIEQYYSKDGYLPFDVVELQPEDQLTEQVFHIGQQYQQSLSIENKPICTVLIKHPSQQQRLLIVIHHLLTDWISGMILAEDLRHLVEHYSTYQHKAILSSSWSFKQWTTYLSQQAQQELVLKDLPYWKKIEQQFQQSSDMPVDYTAGVNNRGSVKSVSMSLNREQTNELIRVCHHQLNSSIEIVVLATVLYSIQQWSELNTLAVDMDSHGRHELWGLADISKTLGWFTSVYPLVVAVESEFSLLDYISYIQQCLQQVPQQGLSYGMLRYLNQSSELKGIQTEILFNYFGHSHVLDSDVQSNDQETIKLCHEPSGAMNSPEQERNHTFEILSMIQEGEFHLAWHYSQNMYREETIQALTNQVQYAITQLIVQTKEKKKDGKSI